MLRKEAVLLAGVPLDPLQPTACRGGSRLCSSKHVPDHFQIHILPAGSAQSRSCRSHDCLQQGLRAAPKNERTRRGCGGLAWVLCKRRQQDKSE